MRDLISHLHGTVRQQLELAACCIGLCQLIPVKRRSGYSETRRHFLQNSSADAFDYPDYFDVAAAQTGFDGIALIHGERSIS